MVGTCALAGGQAQAPQLPKGWSYDVDKHGNRTARGKRVTNPDGSWREEVRQGNCLIVKQRSSTGEYRESRQCRPGVPR